MKGRRSFFVKTYQIITGGVYVLMYLRLYIKLVSVLGSYRTRIIITSRTYFIAFFSYTSRALTTKTKLKTILHHYQFIKKHFKIAALEQLFNGGIECWSDNAGCDMQAVYLLQSKELEFEGSFSLLFKMNNIALHTLSFSFVPGSCFDIAVDTLVFISGSQGVAGQLENISKATKLNKDIIPAVVLMKVLERIAISLNIRYAIGVGIKNQLSFNKHGDYKKFYSNYDEFWGIFGGEKKPNEDYLIAYPLYKKPILLIKQKYRNRTIAKRNMLELISYQSSNYIDGFLNAGS